MCVYACVDKKDKEYACVNVCMFTDQKEKSVSRKTSGSMRMCVCVSGSGNSKKRICVFVCA